MPRRSGTSVSMVPDTVATSTIITSAASMVWLRPTTRTSIPTPTGGGACDARPGRADEHGQHER